MKKNILLVQSLLILPLVIPSQLFSGRGKKNTAVRTQTLSLGDLISANKPEAKTMGNQDSQEPIQQKNEVVTETPETQTIQTLDAKDIIETPVSTIIHTGSALETKLTTSTRAPMALPANLETATETQTTQLIANAVDPKLKAQIESFATTSLKKTVSKEQYNLDLIITDDSKIAAHQVELRNELESFKQQSLRKTTPNETFEVVVILEKEIEDALLISTYNPPIPSKKGLSFFEQGKMWLNPTQFILDAIGSKTFDPQNLDYRKGLNAAIQLLVTQQNHAQLQTLLAACREHYPSEIEIGKKSFLMSHELLKKTMDSTLETLALRVKEENNQIIAQQNVLFATLIEQLNNSVKAIKTAYDEHGKNRNNMLIKQFSEARNIKSSLEITHKLRRDTEMNGYCSDNEDPNVEYYYSDYHLAQKAGVNKTIESNDIRIYEIMNRLNSVTTAIKSIKLLSTHDPVQEVKLLQS